MSSRRSVATEVGLVHYLKAAFLQHWNLLGFGGGAVAATLVAPAVLLPLLGAAELTYLALLVSLPRFRKAVDAEHHKGKRQALAGSVDASFRELLEGLEQPARARFEAVKARCLDMRSLAAGVRGSASGGDTHAEDLRTDALDRMLWSFLRLLYSGQALARFLASTDAGVMRRKLHEQQQRRDSLGAAPDERIAHALTDSIATLELRLDNHEKARRNAELVSVELDRIEGKIHALTEMAVSRQDPDFLTQQVDSVAESMSQTEVAIRELQDITGLTDQMADAPRILQADDVHLEADE
jgi:hypothetical protein